MAIQASSQQGSVRARNRQPAQVDRGPGNPGAAADWMKTGAAAIEGHQRHQEQVSVRREQQQASRGVPFRYRLAKGEEADIVILDKDFGPGLYEHDLTNQPQFERRRQNGSKEDIFVTSPCEWEADPLTPIIGKEPAFVTFLTVIDMRSGVTDAGKPYANTKKLLALKGEAMELLATIRAQRIKAGHTEAPLRGVQLLMKRGTGDQSLKTGLPMFVAHHSEAEIIEAFGHAAVFAEQDGNFVKKGDLIKAENQDCYPIDYARAFPRPSAEAIRARFNLPAPTGVMGSRASQNDGWAGGQSSIRSSTGGGEGGGHTQTSAVDENGFAADLDDEIPF